MRNDLLIKFKETEKRYHDIREKIGRGELTKEQGKDELMRLMIQDENGKYWTLGAKTGKWYVRVENQWQAADPYGSTIEREIVKPPVADQPFPSGAAGGRHDPGPAVDIFDFKSKVETEPDKELKEKDITRREFESMSDPEPPVANDLRDNEEKENIKESIWVVQSVMYLSLMFFCGGLGLICGVLIGATFGIVKTFLPDIATQYLPLALSETRGGVSGGMIFAAIGGIGGFIVFSALALVMGSIYNLIAYVFGGIRFKVTQKN